MSPNSFATSPDNPLCMRDNRRLVEAIEYKTTPNQRNRGDTLCHVDTTDFGPHRETSSLVHHHSLSLQHLSYLIPTTNFKTTTHEHDLHAQP